jgi:hypothetical protein
MMSNINQLVLESFNHEDQFIENYESQETKKRLDNMHIRPIPEWELHVQKPGNLFNKNGERI